MSAHDKVQQYIAKSVQTAIKALTPEQVKRVLQNFEEARYGNAVLSDETVALIGLKDHWAKFKEGLSGWEALCYKLVLAISGQHLGPSGMRGTGFRSQWYGQQVQTAIIALNTPAPVQPKDKAVIEGEQAFAAGRVVGNNPYHPDATNHWKWMAGWHDAALKAKIAVPA
jgi:ribosome modulation factor